MGSTLIGRPKETTEGATAQNDVSKHVAPSLGRHDIPGSRRSIFGGVRLPRIPNADLVHLTAQLAIMIRSGVDLVSALESLARQSKSPESKEVLSAIHQDVVTGKPFSVALSRFDFIFGKSFVASVNAGEASGKMWQVLDQLSTLRGNSLKLRQKMQTMLAYPVALTSISLIVIAALVFGVLPQFAAIFNNYDITLPWITRALLGFSAEVTGRLWLWIPLTLVAIFMLIRFIRSTAGKELLDRILLNFTFSRNIVRCLLTGRAAQLLGLLIESGVPLVESLRLVRDSMNNVYYKRLFSELEESVVVGNGLGSVLSKSMIVPPSASEMIVTAEQTGTLATVTQLVGRHYEEEGEEKLRKMTAYLEPLITVLMGIVVAAIVMSVALPMFDLASIS